MDNISYEKAKNIICKADTYQDIIILSAYYGILMCDVNDYILYLKNIFGKPVIAQEELREVARKEVEAILCKLNYN